MAEHRRSHRRDIVEWLEPCSDGQAYEFCGADDIGAEQLAVRQNVVDQRCGMHDQIDVCRQSCPCCFVQAQIGLSDIAGDNFKMAACQRFEMPAQLGIAAVEHFGDTLARCRRSMAAYDADQLAVYLGQPLQPFDAKKTAEKTVRPGQQHGFYLAVRLGK